MPVHDAQRDVTEVSSSADDFKKVFTWRGVDATRLEQVRVQVTGLRVKAFGQVIGAATDTHEAFSATYDLLTNDAGVTRRLSVHLARAGGETQISITRDGENNWLVQTPQGTERSDFGGAQDVDLVLSPFFNALPIRRLDLHRNPTQIQVPVVYLYLPEGSVAPATVSYDSSADGIAVQSPVGSSSITTDDSGFVRDYEGLAERI
ncbi:putative glycolipid-binding domain-containing protein [Williamsia herbipolensis]|uniref:Glycolipid-binding domain-containing protein n=1 Tax=Williamsia herbipolensis TaxID=1603258 RepID=A0AAU4K8L8_9NOCA|nr:putative glycolipid-binding domain-containing protein [Williamsia herbipolensis]